MMRICNVCNVEKRLNALYFYERVNHGRKEVKVYHDKMCKKCFNKIASEKRKEIRYKLRPDVSRIYIRQAIIGHKEEPYYPDEDFEYKAPTYEQIMKEYELLTESN